MLVFLGTVDRVGICESGAAAILSVDIDTMFVIPGALALYKKDCVVACQSVPTFTAAASNGAVIALPRSKRANLIIDTCVRKKV